MNVAFTAVARDVAIVLAVSLVGGFVFQFIFNGTALGILISLCLCLGFTICAYRTRCENWPHLIAVTMGVWLLGVIVGFIYTAPTAWELILALFVAFFYMLVGYFIAWAIIRWQTN